MSEDKYWLGFNLVKGIGPAKVQALLSYYGDIESAWTADDAQLQKLGLDKRARSNLRTARATLDLDRELEKVRAKNITMLHWDSPDYPSYLREVDAPPPLLYVVGSLEDIDRWAVAVVGTRRVTPYGRQITQELVTGLVRNGVTIISGLARGIDAIAHKTALDHGGRTIAVLGSGPDNIYPPEHRDLARQIVRDRGAVISEFALGTEPEAKNFPPRNRIISGLSLGVVVVEAGARSGAGITAQFALDQNREVFAVPGNVNSPSSRGTNRLIQLGEAKLIVDAEDVLEELNLSMVFEHSAAQEALPETAEEAALFGYLSGESLHIDALCRATGLSSQEVSSTLTLLELKGIVRQVGGMNYVMVREPEPAYEVVPDSEQS